MGTLALGAWEVEHDLGTEFNGLAIFPVASRRIVFGCGLVRSFALSEWSAVLWSSRERAPLMSSTKARSVIPKVGELIKSGEAASVDRGEFTMEK